MKTQLLCSSAVRCTTEGFLGCSVMAQLAQGSSWAAEISFYLLSIPSLPFLPPASTPE